MTKKIGIVGAGAAGMMCAATLIESGADVQIFLFDKNNGLGKKVLISGGGRCNVTTGINDRKTLLTKYIRGSEWVKHALGSFPPSQVVKRFEQHGVKLKCESDLRVFPVSDNGADVVGVFKRIFTSSKITVCLGEGIEEIQKSDEKFHLVTSQGKKYDVDSLVLTTGGNAYAHTGSTGDGYNFVKALGHTITPLGPSLNSFLVQEEWVKRLSGLTFSQAKLEVMLSDGSKQSFQGSMLCTHFGISGPATFVISAYSSFEKIDTENPLKVSFSPDGNKKFEDRQSLFLDFLRDHPHKQILTFLDQYFPRRFAQEILDLCQIVSETKINQLPKDERKQLLHLLSGGCTLTCVARRPGDEFVTAGGVSTDEVSSKTMESKLCPGLYFAGEILNIDGVTGGFNLQSSRATGRVVGENIMEKKKNLE